MENILRSGFETLSLSLGEETIRRFKLYYEYLEQQNALMNLSAISGEKEVATLHFLDCAAMLSAMNMKNATVIDIGSGAGFPGLVLKIAEPSISITFLDSNKKRVDFISEACGLLGFGDEKFLHSRAEEAPACLRESFDFAVSRAVSKLAILSELCLPFVRVGGCFVAMKGPNPAEEISEAEGAFTELGAELEQISGYTIPETDIKHSLVVFKKTGKTPAKYPRRFARIKKSPL